METLSTFEKCKTIRNSLLTRVGEAMSYSWSNEFKVENLNDIHKSLKHWEEKHGSFKINPQDLTIEEMKELGFGSWSEESKMRLIPIWLFPFLCEEFESTSISGSKHLKLSELDNDHRFGCLAYGVVPK
jgi:hypothetical protein